MSNNYENLGFEIIANDKASLVLDNIIKRLERIQQLGGGSFGFGGNGKGSSGDTKKGLSETEKLTRSIARQTELLESKEYKSLRTKQLLNEELKKKIDNQIKEELGIKDTTNSLGKYLSKLTSVVIIARKVAQFTSKAIQESAAYTENLNLFAVAYGEAYQEQLDWALGIAKAYGLANNEVLKFAGTFRELSTSLGLVSDTADLVSQVVTNLGYDLSALFNTTVEQAMEKLQSGIFSGNVRPLRSYGIDISQTQIDALFETNEALRQLGVNSKNLSQSDKVIARLIITLQSGKDSFGTMAREINNLQSQFRIFQGSLANFKLAIGDLLEEPLSNVMVLVNAIIIALTDIIRAFVPLQTEDKTPKTITNIVEGTEEANEEIDTLQGKLAKFDKFNVLQDSSGSNLSVTEELNKLLEEQANIYNQELNKALEDMTNQAVELAGAIKDVVIISTAFFAVWSVSKIITVVQTTKLLQEALIKFTGATKTLNAGISMTNTLLATGIVYAFIKMVEAIKEGDTATATIAGTLGIVLVGALIAVNAKAKQTQIELLGVSNAITKTQYATLAMSAAFAIGGMATLLSSEMSAGEKLTHTFIGLAAAITAAAIGLAVFKGNWAKALTVAASVAGGYFTIATLATQGFAEGGYTNANLIMTHENGKREWVGKAAGSSAIVNDTQMSDIMEVAVAKGVYNALSARSDLNGGSTAEQPIIVKIGEQEVFTAVRKTAKKQGLGFANI